MSRKHRVVLGLTLLALLSVLSIGATAAQGESEPPEEHTLAAEGYGLALFGGWGSVDVHAVTFSVSNLALAGKIPVREATLAILLAFLANMVVKLAVTAWVGTRKLLLVVAGPLLAMMAAGVLAYLFWPN